MSKEKLNSIAYGDIIFNARIAQLQSVEAVHGFIIHPDLEVSMANIGIFSTPVENTT